MATRVCVLLKSSACAFSTASIASWRRLRRLICVLVALLSSSCAFRLLCIAWAIFGRTVSTTSKTVFQEKIAFPTALIAVVIEPVALATAFKLSTKIGTLLEIAMKNCCIELANVGISRNTCCVAMLKPLKALV